MMKAIVAVFGLLVLLSSASAATTKPCFTSTQGCATARCGFNTTCVEDLTTCTFACKTCAERNLGCATVRCAGTPCTEEPGTCIPTCGIPSTPNPTPTPVCRDGNETFAVGATRKMDCNTCSCRENGQWMCTLMACPLPKVTLCPNGSPQPASTLAMEQDACRRAGCTSTETCIYNTCPNFPILNTPMGVATCVKRACQEDLQGNKVYCGAAPANIWDASGKCPFRICYGPGTCSGGVIDYSLPFPCAPMNDWEGERRCTNFDGTSVALGSQIPKLVESIDATGMITWKADGINVCICQGGMDGPPPRLVCSQAAVVEPTTRAPTTRVPTAKPTTPTPCRACPFSCGFNPAFQCVNDANGCGQCINTATGAPTTPTPCRACPFSCGFNPAFQCVNDANGCGQCVNTAVTTTPPTTPTTSCSVLRGTGNCPLGTACVSGPCPGGLICVDPPGTCQPITCSVLRGTGNCPNGTACVSGPCPGGLICIDPPGTCQPTEPPCRACPFSCGFNPAFQCVNDANGCGQCVNTAGTTRVPTTATPTTPTPACRFGDQTFAVGASRQEDCNTCSCRPNGSWICTLRACPPPDVCATVNPCISTLCPTGTTCEKEVRNGQCEPVCKPMTCSVLRGTGNCPPGTTCVSGPCPGGLICVDPPGTCQPQTCADRFQGCSRVRCDTGLICQEDPKTCAAKCVAKCPSNWISGANQCGRQCSAPTQTCLSHLINQEREHRDDPSVNKYCNVCTKSTLCDASSVAQSFKMTTLRTSTKKDVINILNELAKSFLKGSPANTFQLSSNEINVVSTSSRGTIWSVKVFFRNNKCDVKLFWADKYKDALFEQRGITSTVSTQGVTSSTSFEMTQEDVDTFTTEAATLTTQTCVDGSEISAEQTCLVEEMIVPTTTSSSSSSSSTPIAAIVGGIVGGIVLLTLIIATVIIMRRRRHANTIKSIAQETQMTGSEQRV